MTISSNSYWNFSTGLEKAIAALAPAGFLVIGAHEHLPEKSGPLVPLIGSRLIYRRRP